VQKLRYFPFQDVTNRRLLVLYRRFEAT